MIVLPPSTRTLSKEAEVVARVPLADIGEDAANPLPARTIHSSRAIKMDTGNFFMSDFLSLRLGELVVDHTIDE
jgi:hypothetical protein